MPDTTLPVSNQPPTSQRKLWPWVISSIVALLAAIFLTVWVPQEQGENLLERIEAAGGSYSLDTSDRPEAGSLLEDFEYVELFDHVDYLTLPRVDSALFRDAITAFTSLERLNFDLGNSRDFDRELAADLSKLEWLEVIANEDPATADYSFLAGCPSLEELVLTGEFHDDGFWDYLPDMTALTDLGMNAGRKVQGSGIPDLSKSKLEYLSIYGAGEGCEFQGFEALLTPPHLKVLSIEDTTIDESAFNRTIKTASLEKLYLTNTHLTDRILPAVGRCKSLQVLHLSDNQITGESLDLLASLPLEVLELDFNPLGEAAFRHLSQFGTLEALSLKLDEVQPQWLACWKKSPLSGSLEVFVIKHEGGDEVIDVLMEFSNLKELTIYQRDYSHDAILKLAGHPTLQRLNIEGIVSSGLMEQFREKVQQQGKVYPVIR